MSFVRNKTNLQKRRKESSVQMQKMETMRTKKRFGKQKTIQKGTEEEMTVKMIIREVERRRKKRTRRRL